MEIEKHYAALNILEVVFAGKLKVNCSKSAFLTVSETLMELKS
jgi:hypothetical protein